MNKKLSSEYIDRLNILQESFHGVNDHIIEIQINEGLSIQEAIDAMWFDCSEDIYSDDGEIGRC